MYKLENNVEWTEELKNAFKHNVTRASVLYDNKEINEENNLIDLNLDEQRYITNLGFIGSATARKLEINLTDPNKEINVENKDLILKIGADYNGDTYYINYGNFIVDKPPEIDETNGKVRIVAYDYMIKFNKMYVDRVTYPCTLLRLLQDICSQAGVTLATTNFANKDFMVEDNQFEGATLREVLQNIAKCAFSWARIGQDNKLYLDFNLLPDATERITIDDYKTDSFKKANDYYGPVNQVTYADSNIQGQEERVPQNPSSEQIKELVIYDNLFAYTSGKRQELIQSGVRLLGLTYMPVTQLETIGLAYLDCCDIIEVETLANETFTTRVFNHRIEYKGILSDSITAEGTSDNQEAYKNTATTVFQNQQTRIIVDKAKKQINAMVEDITEQGSRISQLQIDLDGIETEVAGAYDLTRTREGTRQILLEECLEGYILEMHIIGNNIVFGYIEPIEEGEEPYRDSNIIVIDADGQSLTYDLGVDEVLRANDEAYDEYILKDNHAQVIRRVNSDGTTKETEVTQDLGEFIINVSEGNNTVRIQNYAADFNIKYIPKNNFTNQFVASLELGTKIIQNEESVKIAWNQIAEAIQLMTINGNASLAIIDENGKIVTSFDKTGQHFYDSSQQVFGDMGVKKYTEYDQQGNPQTYNYLAFSVPANYGSYTSDGMAWGIETPDKKFYPIMFVRDFYVAPQQSGAFGGRIRLNNCDIEVGSTSGIITNAVRLSGEPTGEMTFISDNGSSLANLLTLYPEGHYDYQYGGMRLLDKISFFKNQLGSNTFMIGDSQKACLIVDDGTITVDEGISAPTGYGKFQTIECYGNIYCNNGVQPFSLAEKKKNIKKYGKSGLEEVLNTHIYTYNYKDDKEDEKVRVGAIIGDGYSISKDIVGSEGKGIDMYSMESIGYKAIQEMYEIIQKQQKQIEDLRAKIEKEERL